VADTATDPLGDVTRIVWTGVVTPVSVLNVSCVGVATMVLV
jgi:hypothetical protein